MNRYLIIGNSARPQTRAGHDEEVLELRTEGPNRNLRIQIDVFRAQFLRELQGRVEDLLYIAAFVYGADTRITRGTEKDVFAERWMRNLRIVLPVWDLQFWQDQTVLECLKETLNFLTGDEYTFEFTRRRITEPRQTIIQIKEPPQPLPKVDTVALFSGGSDSLAATLEIVSEGRHPILVSHRSSPVIDRRQKNLVEQLRLKFPGWAFPHISMWVNRTRDKRTIEFSQRSRSFLFTSLGAVTAAQLNINEVRLCDNGIVSINLPQSAHAIGTFRTRSTHPRYLDRVQRLLRLVTEIHNMTIRNTMLFKTKKEALETIVSSGHPELLQETVSCAHFEGKTKLQPHCGVCSQCIDRRFASEAAGLTDHDLVTRYEKDIFKDQLTDGSERTYAENYVRFATDLERIKDPNAFFEIYTDLYDCLPDEGDVDSYGRSLWDLYQRHQQTVNQLLERKIQEHSQEIRKGTLPINSLLRLVASGEHMKNTRESFIERLRLLFCENIPIAFQSKQAEDEHQVQDIGETILNTAQEKLRRECPQIPFGAVTTKPDFSEQTETPPLFIEFKFIKERTRLNGVVTEMTSRTTIYRDQGAWVLFIVYDPNRIITNDKKFVEPFENHEGIRVGMVR